jgi:hypothetical protein
VAEVGDSIIIRLVADLLVWRLVDRQLRLGVLARQQTGIPVAVAVAVLLPVLAGRHLVGQLAALVLQPMIIRD